MHNHVIKLLPILSLLLGCGSGTIPTDIPAADPATSTDPNLIKCAEGIHPFIRGGTAADISKDSADVTSLSQDECLAHLVGALPQIQHKQPVLLAQHHALTRTRSVPRAKNKYHYINDSSSDDGYYHRAWLRTFEIYLQDDFRASIMLESMLCAIPNDGKILDEKFKSCPASYTNPDVFGGTRLEFDGKMIRYTFGLNQPSGGYRPIIPGINPDVDEGVFFSGDTTLSSTRMFGMSIDFETSDLGQPAWSATTTARAEVIHTVIPKGAFDRIPDGLPQTEDNKGKLHGCKDGSPWTAENSWCPVGDYQWVDIGTTVSVWEVVR